MASNIDKKAKLEIEATYRAIELLMSNSDGRAFLRYFINRTGVLQGVSDIFTHEQLFYFEGKRIIGIHLLELLKTNNKDNLSILLKGEYD